MVLQFNLMLRFAMHGNGRGAKGYWTSMLKYAKQYKFLLIVPEFDRKQFSSRDYHQGGVFDKNNKKKDKEDWTFSMIEPLFDYVKNIWGTKAMVIFSMDFSGFEICASFVS